MRYICIERESKIDEKPVKDTEGQAEQVKHRIQGERGGGVGGGGGGGGWHRQKINSKPIEN